MMKDAPLFKSLGLQLRGVDPDLRFACQIVGACELRYQQKELNYLGPGEWNARRGEICPPWPEFCEATAGFTEATFRNLFLCAEAVRIRLAAASLRNKEADRTWELMETPPSELSDEERQELVKGILKHALKPGDTRQSLANEFKPPIMKLRKADLSDPGAAERGEQPPMPGDKPANRFRDLVAFSMAKGGLDFKRACQIAMHMMPEEMLTPTELAWKRLRKELADNFFETVANESDEP
jgi:hypothetical protein